MRDANLDQRLVRRTRAVAGPLVNARRKNSDRWAIGTAHGPTRRRFLATGCGIAAALALDAVHGRRMHAGAAAAVMPAGHSDGVASPREPCGTLRSMWVTVDGLPIHALVSDGSATTAAPPVVLVHGLALSGQYMVPTAELLACSHRIYVPDLPGFGDSGKPDHAHDVPGLADALAAWMRAAGLERAMLLGNSFGCQIIVDLAARHPERVDRAVLQGPTTPPDERTWLQQFIRWQQNSPYNPPSLGPITLSDYRKCGLVRALLTFQFSLEDRVEDKLPHVAAPMLVVRGELDPICNQDWAEYVARRLPRGRLAIIPDVAHTLVYTAAPELVAVSQPFLEDESLAAQRQLSRRLTRRAAALAYRNPPDAAASHSSADHAAP